MSLNIEAARVEDDGTESKLENLRNNPVAETEAQVAVEAAHRLAMEGETKDERENAAAAEKEENK